MDDLDAKLARLGTRVAQRTTAARLELEREPALLELAELARERFGASLTWLRTDSYERGQEIPHGIRPAPYTRPSTDRRGAIGRLRSRERRK